MAIVDSPEIAAVRGDPGRRRRASLRKLAASLAPVPNALIVAFCVVVVTFFLIRVVLGDPAYQYAMNQNGGQPPAPSQVAAIRHSFGLDRPVLVQFGSYLVGLLHGDMGFSYQNLSVPVSTVALGNLGTTAIMTALTIVTSALIGIVLGLAVALARFRTLDNMVRLIAMVGISAPTALVGLMLILSVSVAGRLLPAGGWGSGYPENFRYLVLPVATLVIWFAPAILRVVLERARAVFDEPFVEAALARGVPPLRLVVFHVLPSCALPVINFLALKTAWLLGGAVVTELVFGMPGLGHTMSSAITAADYPVIQACALLAGLLVVACTMTAAIVGRAIDPRTR
ncbi:ABC transporter permease [Streptomyces scopuliridis]|uniref:ABC transporter permease n=1 Tax=Streptomyces scopuliridis TaxID=452529 RepID=UPI0036A56DF9